MLCPYCNNEMQHGEIFGDARGGMRFREDGKKLGFLKCLLVLAASQQSKAGRKTSFPPTSVASVRK